MITKGQLSTLAKKAKINETTIFREYLQLWFLSQLYSFPLSKKIFFKGGTALHLVYKSPRFSEDLDFTVELQEREFSSLIFGVFKKCSREEEVVFKERKTVAGKKFLLTAKPLILPLKTFVNLDFSFREKVFSPQKSLIETNYPVLFTSFVYHLAKEEIWAEKIRAILTRGKGRDLYDLWFLLNLGVKGDSKMVMEKLKYYGLKTANTTEILSKMKEFSEKDFVLDIRPFVPADEREKLPEFFRFIQQYLTERIDLGVVGNKKSAL